MLINAPSMFSMVKTIALCVFATLAWADPNTITDSIFLIGPGTPSSLPTDFESTRSVDTNARFAGTSSSHANIHAGNAVLLCREWRCADFTREVKDIDNFNGRNRSMLATIDRPTPINFVSMIDCGPLCDSIGKSIGTSAIFSYEASLGFALLLAIGLFSWARQSWPFAPRVRFRPPEARSAKVTHRVLVLIEATSVSGSAKAVLEFAQEAIRDPEHRVELSIALFHRGVGPPENSLVRRLRAEGFPFDIINERCRFDTSVIPQLRKLLELRRADMIWSNSVKSHFLIRLGALHKGRTWLAYHHGYTTTNLKVQLYNQLDRWSLRSADRVVTVCRPFARQLQSRGVRSDRIRVQHLPTRPFICAASEQIMALRSRLGIDESARVLLSVGRLSLEKGHSDLIRAFACVRRANLADDLRLVLVGEGPEQGRIEGLCRRLSIDDTVSLVGHQDEVGPYYSIATVFVLPSQSEGCPNVLLEAIAAGVPVVATSVGGIPELVTDEQDALLTPKHDEHALAIAMSRLLNDAHLRLRLAKSARRVVGRNTPESYFRCLLELFRDVSLPGQIGSTPYPETPYARNDIL
jgi:glycosyltransferase involved in cell wall biosynthesis